ncbi:hypothetical protein HYX11_04980 [Candidatus Woesearchaeota archaeon]|nr:hypothetical protein [Candidatus Woesearchaeota archaeon]
MNSLEQILEIRTDAEKELIFLTKEYPSNPEAILKTILKQKALASAFWLAGTSGLIYAIQNAENITQWIEGIGITLGGVGTLAHSYDLVQICRVYYYLTQPKKWEKIIPSSQDSLFYLCDGKFTNNPTPVEVLLGTRIYPKNNFDDIKDIPSQAYGFVTNVIIREMYLRLFTDEEYDYVPGIGGSYRKVKKCKMQIEFEKEKTAFKFSDEYEVGFEPDIYLQLTKIKTQSISILLETRRNEPKITKIFPCHRFVNDFNGEMISNKWGYA